MVTTLHSTPVPFASNVDSNQLRSVVGIGGRCTAHAAALILGFEKHDIPVLVKKGLLRPLGRPSQNSTKYFPTVTLLALRCDVGWLGKATDAIQSHWRHKNHTEENGGPVGTTKPRSRSQ